MSVDLKVYVQLKTIFNNVDLIARLYSDNGELQYEKAYQYTTMSTQIDLSVSPFPHLSFTESFYTPYYFEQMVVPMTISEPTEYLYISMFLPANMLEILTRLNIKLPATISPVAGDNKQVC